MSGGARGQLEMQWDLAANVVFVAHAALVLFVLLVPLLPAPKQLRVVHFWCTTSILVHWHAGSTVCALTMLEDWLRGLPVDPFTPAPHRSFLHRLIEPVYTEVSDGAVRTTVRAATWALWALNLARLHSDCGGGARQTLSALLVLDELRRIMGLVAAGRGPDAAAAAAEPTPQGSGAVAAAGTGAGVVATPGSTSPP